MSDSEERATKRAMAALDQIIEDDAAWSAALALLEIRALRDHLRRTRKVKGLTQAEVAHRMGFSQSMVSELETKRYPDMHLSTMRRWCMALDLLQTYTLEDISEPEEER